MSVSGSEGPALGFSPRDSSGLNLCIGAYYLIIALSDLLIGRGNSHLAACVSKRDIVG